MKRNLTKLIEEVGEGVSKRKGSFKVTSKNANEYTNKILVDAK